MNKAMFLDRDGVINIDKGYVYKIEDFEFIDGIIEILREYQEKGYLLIIITNQAGIARGYYTEDDYLVLNRWMIDKLQGQGINITKVYYCPHHPEHGIGKYKKDCNCRKPKPGMIQKAVRDFNIDLSNSILIGDKASDVEAGIKAGIKDVRLIEKDTVKTILKIKGIVTKNA